MRWLLSFLRSFMHLSHPTDAGVSLILQRLSIPSADSHAILPVKHLNAVNMDAGMLSLAELPIFLGHKNVFGVMSPRTAKKHTCSRSFSIIHANHANMGFERKLSCIPSNALCVKSFDGICLNRLLVAGNALWHLSACHLSLLLLLHPHPLCTLWNCDNKVVHHFSKSTCLSSTTPLLSHPKISLRASVHQHTTTAYFSMLGYVAMPEPATIIRND